MTTKLQGKLLANGSQLYIMNQKTECFLFAITMPNVDRFPNSFNLWTTW